MFLKIAAYTAKQHRTEHLLPQKGTKTLKTLTAKDCTT
jgi:hypothetical protein